jgi:hypothetical protein
VPHPGAVNVNAGAHVPDAGLRKGAVLFVALTDDGLVSDVKAGENKGKRLVHDHVVRELRGEIAIGAGGDGAGTVSLLLPTESGKSSTIVAFVQNVDRETTAFLLRRVARQRADGANLQSRCAKRTRIQARRELLATEAVVRSITEQSYGAQAVGSVYTPASVGLAHRAAARSLESS